MFLDRREEIYPDGEDIFKKWIVVKEFPLLLFKLFFLSVWLLAMVAFLEDKTVISPHCWQCGVLCLIRIHSCGTRKYEKQNHVKKKSQVWRLLTLDLADVFLQKGDVIMDSVWAEVVPGVEANCPLFLLANTPFPVAYSLVSKPWLFTGMERGALENMEAWTPSPSDSDLIGLRWGVSRHGLKVLLMGSQHAEPLSVFTVGFHLDIFLKLLEEGMGSSWIPEGLGRLQSFS